jgi:hypothetical protein
MVPSMVGALLNNIPTLWAVPLAGFIGAVTYELSTFCASDPPSVPSFTAQDVIDILNPYNPITYGPAQDKFQQLVGAYAWYQVCKCDTVSTPAPPSPPSAPSGMPSINPPAVAPSYPTGQACASYDFGSVHFTGTVTGPFHNFPIGQVTYGVLDIVERSRATASPDDIAFNLDWLNSSGTRIGGTGVGLNTTADTLHAEQAVPSGTTAYRLYYSDTVGLSGPIDVHTVATFYCGGSTPGSGSGSPPAPCPTDPFVQAMLEQILALVTIIQRQAAPFAYVASTSHTGLTGRGSISVQGLIGAKIEVTAHGTNTGDALGDPDVLWDAGWVNWGSADGVSSRQFITNAEMLTLPSLAGQYTEIHYSLEPGVTITITELEREP